MVARNLRLQQYVYKGNARSATGILLLVALVMTTGSVAAQSFLEQVGGAVSDGARAVSDGAQKFNDEATKAAQKANEEATRAAAEANRRATEATAKANEEATRAAAEANRKATEALAKANEEATKAAAEANRKATEGVAKANEEATKVATAVNSDVTRGIASANQQATQALTRTNSDITQGIQHAAEQAKKIQADAAWNIEKAARDTGAEIGRVARSLEDAGQAIGQYLENQYRSTGQTLTNAERRMREGKVVDAIWHLASEPIQETSKNAALAAQESAYINTVAQVAATAYGGPQGAAAYAAWLTYNQTGSADLALRAGVLTFATSTAFQAAGSLESNTTTQLARKVAITASVGGIAIAAAGGNEQAIREGFFRAGAMVLVQDGYKRYLGSELDARSSKGEAYCMSAVGEACSPPEAAYVKVNGEIVKDSQGLPVVDMSKVDPRIPHVGKWSGPTAANWTQERSAFMTSVSRVPGMNAMALFHDQWSVSWDMGSIANPATIVPAIVLTYTGTGTDYYDLLQKAVATPRKSDSEPQATPVTALAPPRVAITSETETVKDSAVTRLPLNALRSNSVLFSAMCSGASGNNRVLVEVTEPYGTACRAVVIDPTDVTSVLKSSGQVRDCLESAHSHIQQLTYSKNYCFTRDTAARIDGESAPEELARAVNEVHRRPFPGWRLQTIGATFLALLLLVGSFFGFFSGRFWQHRKHERALARG